MRIFGYVGVVVVKLVCVRVYYECEVVGIISGSKSTPMNCLL